MRATLSIAVLASALLLGSSLAPADALAQGYRVAIDATGGSGLSVGGGNGAASVQRSPMFVDVAVRTWEEEDPTLTYGASVRLEVEDRASAAIVPRVELTHSLGAIVIRPGVGIPVFFAPFTMAGLELSLDLGIPLGERVRVSGAIFVDAFVFGSDVPEGSAVLMFNGVLGVGIVL